MSAHYGQSLYTCPVPGCRVNLRRYVANDGLEDHFDTHLSAGKALPQAVRSHIPQSPHSLLPPIPEGQQPSYQVLHGMSIPATFKRNSIAKVRKHTEESKAAKFPLVGGPILKIWLEEEEDRAPAGVKLQQTRNSKGAATQPAKRPPSLPVPPKLPATALVPVSTSVGFDSPGFFQTAREAFAIVAAQSSDEDTDSD
ncbi:hypothetical protein FRC07_009232 [Ceratobasidium sp. 392]|nr:hypothetical protein FRC07_009232 [Ceratobasidium sp. 392]